MKRPKTFKWAGIVKPNRFILNWINFYEAQKSLKGFLFRLLLSKYNMCMTGALSQLTVSLNKIRRILGNLSNLHQLDLSLNFG